MKASLSHRRARAGMTLLEVLLALVIVGVGIVPLLSSANRCVKAMLTIQRHEEVRHLLARVELESPIDREELEVGSEEGQFDGDYIDYRWRRTVEEVGEEDEDGIYQITTRVMWSDKGREAYEEIVTLLFAPELAEGGSFEG